MAKLVATYTEGFFAVFTENRTGMQQRALIDIGDKVPTPKEMAELAGVLSDQWGWGNVIERSPSTKAKAIGEPKPKRMREYDKADSSADRPTRIVEFLATNSGKHDAREIVKGCGFDDSQARLARWHHTFTALVRAGQIVGQMQYTKGQQGGTVRKRIYSLP